MRPNRTQRPTTAVVTRCSWSRQTVVVRQNFPMNPIKFAVVSLVLSVGSVVAAPESRDLFANSLPAGAQDIHDRAKLIDLWSNASRKPLGKEDDEIAVRTIKLPDGLAISTVRWLSADAAVAQCDLKETRYLAFFHRDDGKWSFVKHYSLGKPKK